MNNDAKAPAADLAKSQDDSVKAEVYGPPVMAAKGKKVNRRIDQPQAVKAPYQLPAFRDLQRLMNAIRDEGVDLTNFCDVLGDVPQVKNLILRDARSILASRGNRIETIKHAVAMLGLRKIRLMLAELAEPYEGEEQNQLETDEGRIIRVSA